MRTPLVDSNTLIAVESLFRAGTADPWARNAVRNFTDLFVYSDRFRFTLPYPGSGNLDAHMESNTLDIIHLIRRYDKSVALPQVISTAEPRILDNAHLDSCFESFVTWSFHNKNRLADWLNLHKSDQLWIIYLNQVPRVRMFDLDRLESRHDLKDISTGLGINTGDILYAFDGALRYPFYGEFVSEDEYYLHHEQRNSIRIPTATMRPASPPRVPISFGRSFERFASQLTLEEYVQLILEIRSIAQERKMSLLPRREVERETLRELAASLKLPPRLRPLESAAGIGAALVASLTVVPDVAVAAAVAGVAVSISAAMWNRPLPRAAARVGWLRWALEWDLEDERHEGD